jgi:class 3 adenylate cyclase/uncharacterized protein (DUF697 family)
MPDTLLYHGTVMFTDMKDFTFRSSVLDRKNIDILIQNQKDLIFPSIEAWNGKIVKTIGDSYMVVFRDTKDAVYSAIEIQKASSEYNNGKNVLEQIEFRIALSSGELSETPGIQGNDYFWLTVNLASRILIQTRAGKIVVSEDIIAWLDSSFVTLELWKISFKGLLEKVNLYEILYKEEEITNLKKGVIKKDAFRLEIEEKIKNTPKEIDDIIFKISSVCAVVTLQPIPLLDIYTNVPLQLYMMKCVSEKYGLSLRTRDMKEILGTMGLAIGGSFALSQGIIAFTKIGIPLAGAYFAAPMSFAFTYALWKTMNAYLYYKSQHITLESVEIKKIFLVSRENGVLIAKEKREEVLLKWKKSKNEIFSKIQSFTHPEKKS